jgi:hypothetical protein
MAFMTKTLELVFASPQHNTDYKVRVQKYAASVYRNKIRNLNPLVMVMKFKLTSVVETDYSVRNVTYVSYVVRFTLDVQAPATDIASKALEACFEPQIIRKPVTGDNFVLIARSAT